MKIRGDQMEDLKKKIKEVLKKEIAPELEKDGGGIELVDVREGTVYVRFRGACVGCPMAAMTLSGVVEEVLKKKIKEVKGVRTA